MIQYKFKKIINQKRTLLGVGPMSLNCTNAAIEIANVHKIPIILVASRRQIDSEEFGGGYVNNWTTREFADYVIDKDKCGKVILARDHGGPWQNPIETENNLSLPRAMQSAKESYKADIEAGFKILHIDPSIDIHGTSTLDDVLDRIFELYEFCSTTAQKLSKNVFFEIGTEEQSVSVNSSHGLNIILTRVNKFCKKNKFRPPLFVVVQNGTKVMEMRNIGSLDSPVRIVNELAPEIQIPMLIDICNEHKIYMKSHNSDYLSNETLKWYPHLGVHSANIAPEFGVAETKALIEILDKNGLTEILDKFLHIAYQSGKWKKWMLPNTTATSRDCAIIAGHYVFSDNAFIELKTEASKRLSMMGVELDVYLKDRVKESIFRYIKNFRLV